MILDEVTRNVLDDYPDIDPLRFVEHTIARMRAAFPEAFIRADPREMAKVDNHPKDRHVAAVALTVAADAIVTLNVKDFGGRVLPGAGVAVLTPGALVSQLLDDSPEVVVLAVRHLGQRWLNPPRTAVEIAEALAVHPSMHQPIQRLRDLLE